MVKDTRKIKTVGDAVAYFAAQGIIFTGYQTQLIENYLVNGVRPEGFGCMSCDEYQMRLITGNIDIVNDVYGE